MKYFTSKQIYEKYPSSSHYVACWEAQSFENGSTEYLVAIEKTGEKNDHGGDIYRAENRVYFKLLVGDRYILSSNPIKKS